MERSWIALGALGFGVVTLLWVACPPLRRHFDALYAPLPPSNAQREVPYLDGMRGLLALWVALFHAWQWIGPAHEPAAALFPPLRQGNNAVPVFIAISGLLIFRSLRRSLAEEESLGLYFVRRVLRIYPLYAATVVLAHAGGWLSGQLSWSTLASELCALRLLGAPSFSNPPTWSLFVEEGFYLLIPLWLMLARRCVVPAAVVTLCVCLVLDVLVGTREMWLVKFFFVGILTGEVARSDQACAWLAKRSPRLVRTCAWLLLGIALVVLLRSELARLDAQPLLAAACGLLFVALERLPAAQRCLAWRPLRVLGVISYSVYLTHAFVITVDTPLRFSGDGGLLGFGQVQGEALPGWQFFVLYPPAIVFFSLLSYAAIERPFLELRKKLRGPPDSRAGADYAIASMRCRTRCSTARPRQESLPQSSGCTSIRRASP